MQEPEPRIVSLTTDDAPRIGKDSPTDRLEEMLKIANVMRDRENNQAGGGKKNKSKEVRAKRRAQKLSRKKNRYR